MHAWLGSKLKERAHASKFPKNICEFGALESANSNLRVCKDRDSEFFVSAALLGSCVHYVRPTSVKPVELWDFRRGNAVC